MQTTKIRLIFAIFSLSALFHAAGALAQEDPGLDVYVKAPSGDLEGPNYSSLGVTNLPLPTLIGYNGSSYNAPAIYNGMQNADFGGSPVPWDGDPGPKGGPVRMVVTIEGVVVETNTLPSLDAAQEEAKVFEAMFRMGYIGQDDDEMTIEFFQIPPN